MGKIGRAFQGALFDLAQTVTNNTYVTRARRSSRSNTKEHVTEYNLRHRTIVVCTLRIRSHTHGIIHDPVTSGTVSQFHSRKASGYWDNYHWTDHVSRCHAAHVAGTSGLVLDWSGPHPPQVPPQGRSSEVYVVHELAVFNSDPQQLPATIQQRDPWVCATSYRAA